MKKCSFCNSEYRVIEGSGPARCWLCDGTMFVDETEEEARERRKNDEKKELCCPNPNCPPQLRPRAERHCTLCGGPLKDATLELWLEKCVRHWPGEGSPEPLLESAWLLGLSKERAQERLEQYLKESSSPQKEAQPSEAPADSEPALDTYILPVPPTSTTAGDIMPSLLEAVRPESRKRKAVMLIPLLLLVFIGFILWLKSRPQEGQSASIPSTPTTTPSPLPPQLDAPPGMAYVPGGEFTMGRALADGGDEYESPAHRVQVKPFFIDIYEVTRQEYQKCVAAKRCPAPEGWANGSYPSGTGLWPMTGIDWDGAGAYAKWVGKRLPTEEEWEFAARGREGLLFPWGNEWQQGLANANGARSGLANVGEFKGASPFGVFDMIGNAWEWTTSDFKPYDGAKAQPELSNRGEKVIRGGYWGSSAAKATATFRTGWGERGESD